MNGQAEVPAGNRQFAVVNGTVELTKQVTVQWLLASPAKPDAVQYKNVLALRSYDWMDNRKELAASISLRVNSPGVRSVMGPWTASWG